jgi:hypothetical protein
MKNSIIIAITKKASQIYKKYTNKGRVFWQDAMRQASKLIKGIKEGVITFWKLSKNEDDEVIPTTRRVTTLESIGYEAKTQKEPNGLIKLVDLDKYEEFLKGVKISYVISFYPFQIL